ncbi:MAG: hypoxanthine phosphoribosyltransferase [Candidatus Eisenbacteria bacterium]
MQVLLTEEQIQNRVRDIAEEISRDYKGLSPVLIGILRGSFVFLADLVRQMDVLHEIDFMSVSSYNNLSRSSGVVRILKDLERDIGGENVIVVEDIVDSGLTLSYIRRALMARLPRSLRICALLDKRERREVDIQIDYVGFVIPNKFVVGYGLDLAQKQRNLPYIATLEESELREAGITDI